MTATGKSAGAASKIEAMQDIPIQPVAKPILCNPFEEPARHWVYDTQTGEARIATQKWKRSTAMTRVL